MLQAWETRMFGIILTSYQVRAASSEIRRQSEPITALTSDLATPPRRDARAA